MPNAGWSGGRVAVKRGDDRRARDAALGEDPPRDAVGVPHQSEQEVLGGDEVVAGRDRLAQRQLERLLRPRRERPPSAVGARTATRAARQGAGAERALNPLPDSVEVDAERGERVGVEPGLAPAHDPLDLAADPRAGDATVGEDARGPPLVVIEQRQQQVLGADPAVPQPARVAVGGDDHLAGVLREPFEHQPPLRRSRPPPCLRWTACLLTPRAVPMSCHDQPCSRAWAMCSASRRWTRVRSEATARSPTAGSALSTDSASLIASCALMPSTYVDDTLVVNMC